MAFVVCLLAPSAILFAVAVLVNSEHQVRDHRERHSAGQPGTSVWALFRGVRMWWIVKRVADSHPFCQGWVTITPPGGGPGTEL